MKLIRITSVSGSTKLQTTLNVVQHSDACAIDYQLKITETAPKEGKAKNCMNMICILKRRNMFVLPVQLKNCLYASSIDNKLTKLKGWSSKICFTCLNGKTNPSKSTKELRKVVFVVRKKVCHFTIVYGHKLQKTVFVKRDSNSPQWV